MVGLIVLVGEFLIMMLIESIHTDILEVGFLGNAAWKFVDPILLSAFVAPALYFLIFRPLNQQAEIERQLDELRRFQKLTIGRELRMRELVEEIAALRHPPSAGSASDIPVTSGSLEAPHHAAEQPTATQPIDDNQRGTLLFMLEDLEGARKKIEQAHHEWMAALDVVNDPIFLHDEQFRILRCNRAYQQRAGIPFKQIIGQPYYEIFPKTGTPLAGCLRVMAKAGMAAADEEEVVVGDANYRSRTFSVYDEQGSYLHSAHILEDITERKQTAQALYESEKLYRSLFENMLNGFAYCQMIFEQDQPQDFIYLSVNAAFETQTGLKNVVGKRVSEVISGIRQSDPELFKVYGRVSLSGKPERLEIYLTALQQWFWVSVYSPGKGYFVAVFDVITERKRVEEALRTSALKHQLLFESSRDALMTLAPPLWKFTGANQATLQLFGASSVAEFTALGPWDVSPERQPDGRPSSEKTQEMIATAMREGSHMFEWEHQRLDGQPFAADVLMTRMKVGEDVFLQSTVRNITERKQAEDEIQHANRALATLSAVNRNLVHATDENELLQAICEAIVEQKGYRMAWVGYKQHDENKSIRIMARAGHDEGYLDAAQISWAERERGMGPSGRCIRSGATQLCQDIANDLHYSPWRDTALKRGYAASIALPLIDGNGEVFGILNVYAAETNALTPNEIDLLGEMAGDMAFGVHTLHTRHERDLALVKNQEQLVQLQDSLEDTVRAIATIVEMRDPYTAGHQIRVADLAMTIARQMGLPDEQIHAIHLAGIVHDLGKIQIPAEILSKPGKITDIEYSLIKIHPQAGYDILKGIDFPWPIAQMVLQHHERIDGSGYPQGLKGDAILLEARILSVADVVEAISAYRPYRPGLGIDIALEEITKNRGVYYDSHVVDACLAVFREQHYSFKS